MFEQCLIGLHRLSLADRAVGMCRKDLLHLFGTTDVAKQLPFTRYEFITEKPASQQGMSISGAQPKLSLILDDKGYLQVTPDNGTYILKPSPEQYPGLAENEHAIMSCMRLLGFEVPPFGLIPFATEDVSQPAELTFIIKRYDRGDNRKIHQEQLDGAMAISDKYGLNELSEHTVSYERAAKFITGNVDSSLAGKRDIFLRILCAYLFGNNDFHLRNIGLLYSPQGVVSIAPVYDFVSVVPYPSSFTEVLALPLLEHEERNQEIARGLNSYLGEYTGHDFIELAEGMGIKSRLAEKYIITLTGQLDRILSVIESSYMLRNHKARVSAYIRRRVTLLNTFALD